MTDTTAPAQSLSYTETTTVDIGAGPHAHVAFSGSTNTIWALNGGDGTVSLLDASTAAPISTIELGGSPTHIIIDDKLGQAFLPLAEEKLAVVSLSTGEVVKTVRLPEGSRPTVLVPQQDLGKIYVLNGNGTVTTVGLDSLEVVNTVTVGAQPSWGQPHKVSFGKMHVTNQGSDTVSVIDDMTGDVVATVVVGKGPNRNAVYRERQAMYTANLGDHTLSGVSVIDDTVVGTAKLGVAPFRLVPAEKKTGRSEIWVLGRANGDNPGGIEVVDATTHEVSHQFDTVDNPANWLFEGPIGRVVSTHGREMVVFDTRSIQVIGTAALSRDPDLDCASNMVMNKTGHVFLVNADNTVTLFAPAS